MGAGEAEGAGCMTAYEGEAAVVGVLGCGLWGYDGDWTYGDGGLDCELGEKGICGCVGCGLLLAMFVLFDGSAKPGWV